MNFNQKFREVNLIFGNHSMPEVLDETFDILKKSKFFKKDTKFRLKKFPEDNAINLVVEESAYSEKVDDFVKKSRNSQNILLLTEFVTGKTFNTFSLFDKVKTFFLRILISKKKIEKYDFPKLYWKYFEISRFFGNFNFYMFVRFLKLKKNIKNFDTLITYYEHQKKGYKKITKNKDFFILDYNFNYVREEFYKEKKYDFFYSGAVTKYRKKLLKFYIFQGLNIFQAKFMTIKDKNYYQKLSKFSLILPQDSSWKYTSVAKTICSLENRSIPIIQKNLIMHNLEKEKYVVKINQWNNTKFLKELVNKYDNRQI
jgi:hypothetical protein